MLVLGRKIGESIKIGRNIVVTVTHIEHNQVKIGIQAPERIKIIRDELDWNNFNRKKAKQRD